VKDARGGAPSIRDAGVKQMLSPSEIATYRQDGILAPGGTLSEESFAGIKRTMDAFLAARPDVVADYVPHLIEQDRSWLAHGACEEILDVVGQVIGDDIILWGSGLFCKSTFTGKATPWHQDAQYWPIRPLETCTVWIAIDASTVENGCLEVMPGSHRDREIFRHGVDDSDEVVLNQAMDPRDLARFSARAIELAPGEFSVHDAFLVHGAKPNRSGKRRAGLAFRYMPTTSYFDRELAARQVRELGVVDISQRELHLVRGVDRCGRNDVADVETTHATH
jgi:ectoine hydroxylase-related dioxygenase (phytanoyl-CoA dioxygenase family)